MVRRFHVDSIGKAERVRLEAETVRHLHVLGLGRGSEVVLFDGTGREALACIEEISRTSAAARILRRHEVSREAETELTLACAPPKGRRMDTLVRMCAELGVRRIVPLIARRSVVRPTARDASSHKLERWRKICVAASEQSGRNVMTSVDPPVELPPLLERTAEFDLIVILSPDEAAPTLPALLSGHSGAASLLILLGPEGGFTEEEMDLATRHGAKPARLTHSTLRIETACVTAAALTLMRPSR